MQCVASYNIQYNHCTKAYSYILGYLLSEEFLDMFKIIVIFLYFIIFIRVCLTGLRAKLHQTSIFAEKETVRHSVSQSLVHRQRDDIAIFVQCVVNRAMRCAIVNGHYGLRCSSSKVIRVELRQRRFFLSFGEVHSIDIATGAGHV